MNKNWFYRVLALALVAMLAVPMFAFAEEDVLATAAEAPAEELATALEGEEDVQVVSKRVMNGIFIVDVYLGYSVVEEWPDDLDINVAADRYFQINLANANSNKKETFKSSNKNVATVSSTGFVTLTGAGKVTITCTGYVDGKKKTTKFSFKVVDKNDAASANGHFFNPLKDAGSVFYKTYPAKIDWGFDDYEFTDDGSENLLENGKKYTKDFYIGLGFEADDSPTLVYEPVPFNADGDWVGPGAALAYQNGYSFKHSNAKVMFFDGNKHIGANNLDEKTGILRNADRSPVDKPFKSSAKFWTGPNNVTLIDGPAGIVGRPFEKDILVPVFYKSGTNKLTIKTMATAGLKSYSYTNTFVIPKEKVVLRHGTDKELMQRAKHSENVLYQIDTIDIQSMDKVVLTMKVYNGTDWAIPVKDVVFRASVRDSAIASYDLADRDGFTPFLQYGLDSSVKTTARKDVKTKRNVKVKGSIKPNKQTTLTITFENHRNGDFNIKSLSGRVVTDTTWTGTAQIDTVTTLKNVVSSNKDALEIMSPYPDVWDTRFALRVDEFYFKVDSAHWYTPFYAFGEAEGPVWIS